MAIGSGLVKRGRSENGGRLRWTGNVASRRGHMRWRLNWRRFRLALLDCTPKLRHRKRHTLQQRVSDGGFRHRRLRWPRLEAPGSRATDSPDSPSSFSTTKACRSKNARSSRVSGQGQGKEFDKDSPDERSANLETLSLECSIRFWP